MLKKIRNIHGQLVVREFLKRKEIASFTADVNFQLKPGNEYKVALIGENCSILNLDFKVRNSFLGEVEFRTLDPEKSTLIVTSLGIPEDNKSNWNQGRYAGTGQWANWIITLYLGS